MIEAKAGKCPVDHGQFIGAKLGNKPMEDVAGVFARVSSVRNPHLREGKKPARADVVVSRFNGEQLPYVHTVIAYLNGLVNGKVFADINLEVPRFADRVVENFITQAKLNNFEQAITDSWKGVLTDFTEIYPNLRPAFFPMLIKAAGTEGIGISIDRTKRILEHSSEGMADDSLVNQGALVSFVDDACKQEVWCVGAPLVNNVRRHVIEAGERIGHSSNLVYGRAHPWSEVGLHVFELESKFLLETNK